MSEILRTPENERSPEVGEPSEIVGLKTPEVAKKVESLDVNEARTAIDEAEPNSKEVSEKQSEAEKRDDNSDVRWWSKELGRQNLDRTLSSVRRSLSAPEKQLSKFIHRPTVEKVSDVGGKTIARPSGILLGGIFSFVGSLGVYLLARHMGGELRYSIFAITFVVGYMLGLIIELIWRVLARKKKS